MTKYEAEGLEPVGCCCSNFDSWPRLTTREPLWQLYSNQEPSLWGYLEQCWYARPATTQDLLELGLTIVDWPEQALENLAWLTKLYRLDQSVVLW